MLCRSCEPEIRIENEIETSPSPWEQRRATKGGHMTDRELVNEIKNRAEQARHAASAAWSATHVIIEDNDDVLRQEAAEAAFMASRRRAMFWEGMAINCGHPGFGRFCGNFGLPHEELPELFLAPASK